MGTRPETNWEIVGAGKGEVNTVKRLKLLVNFHHFCLFWVNFVPPRLAPPVSEHVMKKTSLVQVLCPFVFKKSVTFDTHYVHCFVRIKCLGQATPAFLPCHKRNS